MLKRSLTDELIVKFKEAFKKYTILIENNSLDEALNQLKLLFSDIFRLNITFTSSLYYKDLIEFNKSNGKIDSDKCIMMGTVLKEYAFLTSTSEDLSSSFIILQKSLNLFLDGYDYKNEKTELVEFFSNIDTLYNKLSDFKLSEDILEKLVKFYYDSKMYCVAENILYDLLEGTSYSENSLKVAYNFYTNLLSKSDDELITADLPRDEILDSLNSLKEKENN